MTTTTEFEQEFKEAQLGLAGANSALPRPANPGAEAGTEAWSGPLQARIVRPLCSAPDEPHQARLPAGCCDIQWGADNNMVLLSWWGRGQVRRITIPGSELDRLFAAGLIEWD